MPKWPQGNKRTPNPMTIKFGAVPLQLFRVQFRSEMTETDQASVLINL